ncbi:MAG: hypothetical protein ACOCWQ_02455 [Nanoarchaeota archaeon]
MEPDERNLEVFVKDIRADSRIIQDMQLVDEKGIDAFVQKYTPDADGRPDEDAPVRNDKVDQALYKIGFQMHPYNNPDFFMPLALYHHLQAAAAPDDEAFSSDIRTTLTEYLHAHPETTDGLFIDTAIETMKTRFKDAEQTDIKKAFTSAIKTVAIFSQAVQALYDTQTEGAAERMADECLRVDCDNFTPYDPSVGYAQDQQPPEDIDAPKKCPIRVNTAYLQKRFGTMMPPVAHEKGPDGLYIPEG